MNNKHYLSIGSKISVLFLIVVTIIFSIIFAELFINKSDNHSSQKLALINEDVVVTSNKKSIEITDDMIYKELSVINISFAGIINFNTKNQTNFANNLELDKNYSAFEIIKQQINSDMLCFTSATTYDDSKPYSDTNAPSYLLRQLTKAGFNAGTGAGSNILNNGVSGINSILTGFKNNKIFAYGINTTRSELPHFIKNIDNINIGFLQYTQSISNTGTLAMEGQDIYRHLKLFDATKVVQDISNLKQSGSNIIVACIAWNDDEKYPSEFLKQTAQALANAGADIVIGSCINTPMPFELLTAFNEDGSRKNVPVIYSLGALLNSNKDNICNSCSIILNTHFYFNKQKNTIETIKLDYLPIYAYQVTKNNEEYKLINLDSQFDKDTIEIDSILQAKEFINKLYSDFQQKINIH